MNFQGKRAQHAALPPRTKLRKHRLNRHFAPQSAPPLKTCSAPCHKSTLSEQSAFCRCHCAALRCACSAQHLLAARPAQGSTTSHLFTDRRRWRGVYDDVQLNPVSSKTSAQRPEATRCHRPRAPPPALFVAVQQVRGGGPRLRTQALSRQQTQLDSVSQPKSP